MPINWAAMGTILGGFSIIGAVFLFATRSVVRDEIKKLNGTYIRVEYKETLDARFRSIEDHFDYLRDHPKANRAHGD